MTVLRVAAVVIAPPEIDVTNKELFHAELLSASRDHSAVIVDMTKTSFCDSSGIHVLIRALRRAQADGGDLILAGVCEQVQRSLNVIGIDVLFKQYARADDALDDLGLR